MRISIISTKFIAAFAIALLTATSQAFDQSHAQLDEVLEKYVANKKVDYAGLKKDQTALNGYIDAASKVGRSEFESWSTKQELAFLINVYNAATLKLVVDHYPVKSIKKIGGSKGPWKQPIVRLFGSTYTLDQIEHEMIRPNYNDPRAHFGINCASGGCPSLRSEAYRADRLDAQLDQQGKIFMGDASKNRVDQTKGRLYLSPIYKWFEEDFVKKSGSLEKFIAPFVASGSRDAVLSGKLRVSFTDYDWKLNQQ